MTNRSTVSCTWRMALRCAPPSSTFLSFAPPSNAQGPGCLLFPDAYRLVIACSSYLRLIDALDRKPSISHAFQVHKPPITLLMPPPLPPPPPGPPGPRRRVGQVRRSPRRQGRVLLRPGGPPGALALSRAHAVLRLRKVPHRGASSRVTAATLSPSPAICTRSSNLTVRLVRVRFARPSIKVSNNYALHRTPS